MFILILLKILIISNVICVTSTNIPTSHIRTIRVQTEYRDSHTDKHVYDVALVSTEIKNGFEIVSKDKITDDASWTTRIRCGTTLYESHAFMNNQEGRVFSLSSASDHPAVLLALIQSECICTATSFQKACLESCVGLDKIIESHHCTFLDSDNRSLAFTGLLLLLLLSLSTLLSVLPLRTISIVLCWVLYDVLL